VDVDPCRVKSRREHRPEGLWEAVAPVRVTSAADARLESLRDREAIVKPLREPLAKVLGIPTPRSPMAIEI
jgi:hypothetical protein